MVEYGYVSYSITVWEHISLGICVSQVGEHNHITSGVLFPVGGTHIASNMCSPTRETHITSDMFILALSSKQLYIWVTDLLIFLSGNNKRAT